jgi:hypothetical protein
MRRRVLVLGMVFAAGAAVAETPPPEYFEGRYRAIGRDGGEPPGLVDGDLRLEPAPDGLAVTGCGGVTGSLLFSTEMEVGNALEGRIGDWAVWCLYNSDTDNYPILTCGAEDGLRITLWPDAAAFGAPPRCDQGTPVGR